MQSALEQAALLCGILRDVGQITECQTAPYWKIEEYIGITLKLAITGTRWSINDVSQKLVSDWLYINDVEEAMWDHRMNGPFTLPMARWCQLNYL